MLTGTHKADKNRKEHGKKRTDYSPRQRYLSGSEKPLHPKGARIIIKMHFPRVEQYCPAVAQFVAAYGVNKDIIKRIGTRQGKKDEKKICCYAYAIITNAGIPFQHAFAGYFLLHIILSPRIILENIFAPNNKVILIRLFNMLNAVETE